MSNNKMTECILGITLFITFIIMPLLFVSWRQEKKEAKLYKENFFYLWNKIEKIKNNETSAADVLIYLNDLKKHEEIMNELSEKIKENI